MAVSYIAEGRALPIMFEFAMGDIDRGASISFISQFPGEDEILIPPLSYLEVTGEPFIENTDKGNITVFPGRISCNLKSQTIEEIETKRHRDLVAMMPYLYNDLCRDLDVLSSLTQQNNLLVDDKTYRADDGCTFIPESVESCDKKEIQEWFTTPLLHGIPTSVQLYCMWRSVGSGHSKASLYARASGSSQWTVLSNEKADQKMRPFQVELPSSVFSHCDAGKGSDQLRLQLGYFHGNDGLEICDAKLIVQGAQVRKPSIQQHAHRTAKERGIFSQIWKDFEETEPQRCVLLGSCSVSIVFHAFCSIPIFESRITVLFQSGLMTIVYSRKPSTLLYLSEPNVCGDSWYESALGILSRNNISGCGLLS